MRAKEAEKAQIVNVGEKGIKKETFSLSGINMRASVGENLG